MYLELYDKPQIFRCTIHVLYQCTAILHFINCRLTIIIQYIQCNISFLLIKLFYTKTIHYWWIITCYIVIQIKTVFLILKCIVCSYKLRAYRYWKYHQWSKTLNCKSNSVDNNKIITSECMTKIFKFIDIGTSRTLNSQERTANEIND